ncbi:type I restriction enzyme S subunit [Gracilibacillus halotolerans]|uniref:Type I restriction enzyme S subunit n=1 Tax=Gracilibacillus halotolerans TaxID=74386 RepID=A0A841RLG6_9BACI|nr:restriction endonuclease subunit S [Gracilibacillus halotolerans]MBB6513329.1 type I restriction enzyme S subunit [Gracilibacillus halotolerans]
MKAKLVKLGELYKVTSGGTPSRKNKEYYIDGNIPWIKTGDLKTMYLSQASEYITKLGLQKSSAKLFPKGTVLIAMYGATIGNCSILKIDSTTNQACAAFQPIDEIMPEYLYYYLLSIKEKLISLGVGGAQPNISIGILKNIDIPLISLEQQSKIVSILNKTQGLINKRNNQIELIDQLTQSVFLEIFGDPLKTKWEQEKLQDITDVRDGTHDSPKYIQNGYPLVTSKNIKDGKISLEDVNYISEDDYISINKRSKVDIGDIIMPMIGTIGNPVIVKEEPNFAIKNVALIKFKPEYPINSVYLKYLLDSHFLESILNKAGRGGTQKFLSLKDIRNMMIPLPPLRLQEKFVGIIEDINKNKEILEQSLNGLKDIFNSLMQRAFRGKLFSDI